MGCEGGSLPSRKDMVKCSAPIGSRLEEQEDVRNALFLHCPLSCQPLAPPLVLLKVNHNTAAICNHSSLIEKILSDRLSFARPPRKFKKGKDYVLVSNQDVLPLSCPLTMKQMNGVIPFRGCWPCGCVMSEAALKALPVGACYCGKVAEEILSITQIM